jgi:Tol biopolymer transport system component/DNA-binding winged helix-turn-helix (wHTH) protein
MEEQLKHFYEFSRFRIDPQERVLLRDGNVVPLTPKVFDTLLLLVEHQRQVVSKDELMKFVWPDSFVEEGNLTQNISMLRKLLGETAEHPQYIETVPRRGYRFVAPVQEVTNGNLDPVIPDSPESESKVEKNDRAGWSAEPQLGRLGRNKRGASLVLGLLLTIIAGIAFGLYKWIGLNRPKASPATMTVTRLTYTGKAAHAAISPDGKYLVEAIVESGKQSLWLRQVATSSEIQIVPPAEVFYIGIIFSPDGNFIYFVRGHQSGPGEGSFSDRGALFKMSILGKGEKKLLETVDGQITLSPDGEWLAFVRQYPSQEKSALILARTDGSEEKELATRRFPDNFLPGGPAWSPDGKIIACSTNNFTAGNPYRGIVGIRVADGVESPIGSKHWFGATKRLAWLTDGRGILVLGAEYSRGLNQIWRLSYPGNEAQKVISDLNDYADLSLTADSKMLAVVRADRLVNIWVAPEGDASRAKVITSGTGREDGVRGLTWTPDGRIVYRSMSGEAPQIWIMQMDGTGAKQLTADGVEHFDPAVSPNGRSIVWSSSAAGRRNIWRMNLDGSNPEQVTSGNNEWNPEYTPDGKWLVYATMIHSLWKIPAAGGTPVRLTNGLSWRPAISPDGKWLAYNRLDEASGQWQVAVIPFEGEAAPRIFDAPSPSIFRAIRWTPDGREVAYPVTADSVSNIWGQPLDGGSPRRLTNFKDQLIFDFAWSRDGKYLALSRGTVNSDVVLIGNFK